MKKLLTLVLSLMIALSLMGGAVAETEAPVTLTMAVVSSASILDYNTNDFSKWLEETCNVDLEFIVIPEDVKEEKLNLMLNTGDYPDIWMNAVPDEYMYGVETGILVDLMECIEKGWLPNLKAALDADPKLATGGKAMDGKMYAFPNVNAALHTQYYHKLWYNTMQLEKTGMALPTNAEEFYQAMVKYKEVNPDGIPFTGEVAQVLGFVTNMFTYYPNDTYGIRLVNGTTCETMMSTEEYREALRYLNKLYSEGLLYEATFNMDDSQRKALLTSEGEPILFMAQRHNSRFVDGSATPELYGHMMPVEPLVGPDGETQYTTYFPASVGGKAAISSTCENIEKACEVCDIFYTMEGALRSFYGTPGVHWEECKNGETDIEGEPAAYNRLIPYSNEPSDRSWSPLGIYYSVWSNSEDVSGDLTLPENGSVLRHVCTAELYVPHYQEEYQTLPRLKFTSEETEEINFIGTSLSTYLTQTTVEFIIGAKNLDTDWDAYVAALDNMGMQDLIAYYQAAYDRVA